MRKIKDLTKKEKKEIFNNVQSLLEKEGLEKTHTFLLKMTDINERINWLIKFRRLFKSNSVTFEHLEIIHDYFKEEYTGKELIDSIEEDVSSSIRPTLRESMKILSPFLGYLKDHFTVLLDADEMPYVATNKKGENIINSDRSPKVVHPIDRRIVENFMEKYFKEKREQINVLMEAFHKRESIIEVIPEKIKVEANPGRFPDYPIRREKAIKFWEKHKKTIVEKSKKDGYSSKKRKAEELKKALNGELDHISHHTISSWIE